MVSVVWSGCGRSRNKDQASEIFEKMERAHTMKYVYTS